MEKVEALHDAATNVAVKAELAERLTMARKYAGDAATAAADAEKARDAANAEGVSVADAQAAQKTAEDKQGEAEGLLADAKDVATMADAYVVAATRRQNQIDIETAQGMAKTASEAAAGHYKGAMDKATMARTQATNARNAANKAMRARTNYADAHKYAKMAEEAAGEAEAARDEAEKARDAASKAYVDAMGAATSDDAEMYQEDAEDANAMAAAYHMGGTVTGDDDMEMDVAGAGSHYMDAKAAADMAMNVYDIHVIDLFKQANAYGLQDSSATSDTNEVKAEMMSVGMAIAEAAVAENGAQAGSGFTASASWRGDVADDPTTEDTDESDGNGLLVSIGVPDGVQITAAAFTENEIQGKGIGKFPKGFDVSMGDTTSGAANTQVIAFTNKVMGIPAKDAVTAVTERRVNREPVNTATELKLGDDTAGPTYDGATWTPSGEQPLMGTLFCDTTANCDIQVDSAGAITAIDGYLFTGHREERAAEDAVAASENSDYLLFGLWLSETAVSGATGGIDSFGTFAVGGNPANVANAVTGTASYSGSAVGAHHKTGEGTNWFDGEAKLMADFGTATADGTVSGSIEKIRVNGGDAMSESIRLGAASLTDGSNTFNGEAMMGMKKGTWSGSFFGPTQDDTGTTDVNESHVAPNAAAGTFGVTQTMGTGDDTVVESYVGSFGAHKD